MQKDALTRENFYYNVVVMKKLLNLTELSEYIGIPKRTLHEKVKDKSFPVDPVKGLTPRRWSKDAVDKWLSGSDDK